jgi:hypothetical protein
MIILDTNVLSELMKLEPNEQVLSWLRPKPRSTVFITTITQAEVYFGIGLLPVGKRRQQLETTIEQTFEIDFQGRILPFDSRAARCYGQIASNRRQRGQPISTADAQIAAIASVHHGVLATRNTSDFLECGLQLLNPWDPNHQAL